MQQHRGVELNVDLGELLRHILSDMARGAKGYLRAQVILMGVTFLILSAGFLYLGVPLPLLIALGIALVDFIPIIGSGIVMVPWALISYFNGNRDMAIGIGVLYVVLTVVRQVIEPKVMGDQIGLRPLYTFLATIFGTLTMGPLGFILAPMGVIIVNSFLKYRRMVEERGSDRDHPGNHRR